MIAEWRWVSRFAAQFELYRLSPGELCIVLSESGSRSELVESSLLAAQSLGAHTFQLVMPTPANAGPVPLNFMYSTGANETADRFTRCHFDLPTLDCSVELDGTPVVESGILQGDLVPAHPTSPNVLGPTIAAAEDSP